MNLKKMDFEQKHRIFMYHNFRTTSKRIYVNICIALYIICINHNVLKTKLDRSAEPVQLLIDGLFSPVPPFELFTH